MVFVLLLLSRGASADTFYVAPTGNDQNSGMSDSRPLRVAQQGIDRMQAGDTLAVLDGVYTGTLKLKSGIVSQVHESESDDRSRWCPQRALVIC